MLGGFLTLWGFTLAARSVGMRIEQRGWRGLFSKLPGVEAAAARPILHRRLPDLLFGLFALPIGFVTVTAGTWVHNWGEDGSSWATFFTPTSGMVVLALMGMATIAAGIRFDPSKGRRRCPKCWYDMSGTIGLTCPECGKQSEAERALHRTRAKRPIIIVGFALLSLIAVVQRTPTVRECGWRGWIPTSVLIAGFEWLPESLVVGDAPARPMGFLQGQAELHIKERLSDDEGHWQRRWLLWRADRLLSSSTSTNALWLASQIDDCDLGLLGDPQIAALVDSICRGSKRERVRSVELLTNLTLGHAFAAMRESGAPQPPAWHGALVRAVNNRAADLALVLRDPDLDRSIREQAASLLVELGDGSDFAIGDFLRIVREVDPELKKSGGSRLPAMHLWLLSARSELAHSALVEEIARSNEDDRCWLLEGSVLSLRTSPLLREYVEGFLTHPSPRVAGSAGWALREKMTEEQAWLLVHTRGSDGLRLGYKLGPYAARDPTLVGRFVAGLDDPATRVNAISALHESGASAEWTIPILALLAETGVEEETRNGAREALIAIYNAAVEPEDSGDVETEDGDDGVSE